MYGGALNMILGIFQHWLQRMSSLQNFYELEKEHIETTSEEGKRKNHLGFVTDFYFLLLSNPEDIPQECDIQKLQERIEKDIEIVHQDIEKDNASILFKFKNEKELREKGVELDVKKAANQYMEFREMPEIHGTNTLIMLITRFEEFISKVFSVLFGMFPQKYLDDQKVMFSELVDSNLEQIRELIIQRQVDAKMHEGHTEWFKIFTSHGIDFKHCKDEMNALREIYARRNIMVHNSGKVNSIYLNTVKEATYDIGETLYADEAYLSNAFDVIYVLSFTLCIEFAKLIKDQKNKYLEAIFNAAYVKLCDEKYYLCRKVFNALLHNKYLDGRYRNMSTVNYWLSCIALEGLEPVKKEIEEFDTSALDPSFELAKYMLLQQYDEATECLELLYSKHMVDVKMVETWPLFRDFKNTEQYKSFRNKHIEEYEVEKFEIPPEDLSDEIENGTQFDSVIPQDCETM